jgi:hypothetical protein
MGYLNRLHPDERIRLDSFRNDKYWIEWKSTLNPSNTSYESTLFLLLGKLGLSPSELIAEAQNPANGLSKKVKLAFAQLNGQYSAGARNVILSALRNFLRLNDIELPLVGLKVHRFPVVKPFLGWLDAERIISKANPEYQDCFRVMIWGLDDQRFIELNTDAKRIQEIKRQLDNQAAQWIKIEIPKGRKQSPPYYLLVPRNVAALLPVLHRDGTPIGKKGRMIVHWNTAARRAGFNIRRFGPHQLRSVFRSEATRRKLDPVIAEFQLGHQPDPLNYQRLNQDLKWVLGEFEKAWRTEPLVTETQLADRDKRLEKLEAENEVLRKSLDTLMHLVSENEKQARAA